MAASRSLGSLTLDLIANIGGFTQSLDRASRETDKKLSEMEKRAYEFGRTIGEVIKVAFEVGAVILGLDKIKESIEEMDKLAKAAQKVGLPVEQFTALAGAASLSNVETDSLVSTLTKFSSTIGKATDATSQQAKIFKALGIDIRDQNGQLKTSAQLIGEFADQFQTLGVNTTTTAAGIALFGKNFEDIIPFLQQGSDGIKEAKQEAINLGAALSGQAADAAAKFEDNLTKLKLAGQGFTNQLVQALLPTLNEWTDSMVELAKDHKKVQDIADGLSNTLHVLAAIAIEVSAGFKVIGATVETLTVAIAANVRAYSLAREIYAHPFDISKIKENVGALITNSETARGQIADIWSTATDSLSKSLDKARAQLDEVGKGSAPISIATAGVVALSEQIDAIATKGASGKNGLVKATQQIAALGAQAIKSGEDVKQVQSVISHAIDKLQQTAGSKAKLGALDQALNPSAVAQANKLASAMDALGEAVARATESANPTDKAYNTYADTARNLDRLGAAAIKAGANVKQVQDLVAKGITGAQAKLANDLAAPLKAAEAYKAALDEQLDALKASNDQAARAVGLGTQQAQEQAQLAKVTQDGAAALAKFTRQHAAAIAQGDPQYTKELADLKQYWSDVLAVTKDGQDALRAAQSDWLNGVNKAWQDFITQQNNTAEIAGQLTSDFLNQASDAFSSFIDGSKSAKDALSDFIDSFEQEITQAISKQLLKQLFNIGGDSSGNGSSIIGGIGDIVNLFTGGGYGTGHANGGTVPHGSISRVNERGPELLTVGGKDFLMMGGQTGHVTANERMGRSQPNQTNNFYLQAPTSQKTQSQIANKTAYELRRASRLN